ncbi:MAG TPA: helicase-related protein [Pirellulales bacterium]|nr:helicase-related protein [Pirellulales bacterium]
MTSPITITGEQLTVEFDRFGIDQYDLFLRVKRLPEFSLDFLPGREAYRVSAPARFAHLLGVQSPPLDAGDLPLSPFLFDDQSAIVRLALAAKRFAVWSDCGLGKTLIQLEVARHVLHRTGGRVLIMTMNEIVDQTIDECRKFYGDTLPIVKLHSRDRLRHWCETGEHAPGEHCQLAITNYEKMNPGTGGKAAEVINELRLLSGLLLDESSRLKTGGGKQKWAIIKSSKGIPYKLSCTATPAPNDTTEFASQASFLEKMRSDNEIIWTYFVRDAKTHRWTVKRHARAPFFEFMAGWSIYVRNPKRYGWRLNMQPVPEPEVFVHDIEPTAQQRAALSKLSVQPNGQLGLFASKETNTFQRGKLSQIAKGFRYRKSGSGRVVELIESRKPAFVANLVAQEVAAGLQVLVWTVFDAESTILSEELAKLGIEHRTLTGSDSRPDRLPILERFRRGLLPVLVSRAAMLGYGMNFQCCGSMIFNGWNDSYESYYQAVRRSYRYGQTKRLRVHLPVIRELEGEQLDNILHKQDQHEAAIEEMEQNYIRSMQVIQGGGA